METVTVEDVAADVAANDQPEEAVELKSVSPAASETARPPENSSSPLPARLKSMRTILFSYARPIIKGRPDLSDYLREAAAWLMANPSAKAQLRGYTDDTAARENNLKLGMKRAEAVAALLRAEGVPDHQLILESRGEAEPIGDNNTSDGRQQNRRVEMQLLEQ